MSTTRGVEWPDGVDRRVALAAVAVWVAHGLVDNLTTAAVIYYHGTTVYESNQLLRDLYVSSMIAAHQYESAVPLAAPIVAKAAAAAVAAVLVLALPRYVGRRAAIAFGVAVAAGGLLVVGNNLSALAAAGWSL
jgi:Na+-transporting methylmalonyl-CoA/oxaloacetate decarboxylase beta subunit